ncbi:MAG: prephenate dehydrogenase [Nocardioides sp.]
MGDQVDGPVLIVGTGLLGTSIGLALRKCGIAVRLRDQSREHLRTASGLGAGVVDDPRSTSRAGSGQHAAPALVVVAVPPRHLGSTIDDALAEHPDAVVTDVGSVKCEPLSHLSVGIERYVGSHPMAGSERSGPLAASAALFDGRPWAITPHASSCPEAVAAVTALARACSATPIMTTPQEHDRAVATISHVPYLVAVLMAGHLTHTPPEHLALAGQGVRDVTRVAASDPRLWEQILRLNAQAVLPSLHALQRDLAELVDAVRGDEPNRLYGALSRGVSGTQAIPGKHGGPGRPSRSVFVSVPDHPGELARLFADAGVSEVNIEDVHIDHDPGRPTGLVELVVAEERADHLLVTLESHGWVTHR